MKPFRVLALTSTTFNESCLDMETLGRADVHPSFVRDILAQHGSPDIVPTVCIPIVSPLCNLILRGRWHDLLVRGGSRGASRCLRSLLPADVQAQIGVGKAGRVEDVDLSPDHLHADQTEISSQ